MDIDIDALEASALAATPGPRVAAITSNVPVETGNACYCVGSHFGSTTAHAVTGYEGDQQSNADAEFIAAANPAVVLELVRRLKVAEEKLDAKRPLLIGNVNGDVTLFGSQEKVKAFHLKMRENSELARQATIEECIEIASDNHRADPFGDDTQVRIVAALREFLSAADLQMTTDRELPERAANAAIVVADGFC